MDDTLAKRTQRRVRAWMLLTDRTYPHLADELGITPRHLMGVVYGDKGCSLAVAVKWAEISGLPLMTFANLRKGGPRTHQRRRPRRSPSGAAA